MKTQFLSVLAFLMLFSAFPLHTHAQNGLSLQACLSPADVWINTDSLITEAHSRGHITLVHHLDGEEYDLARTSSELSRLKADYPFLLVIHRVYHSTEHTSPAERAALVGRLHSLPGIIAVDTLAAAKPTWPYDLFDETGQAISSDVNWNSSSIRESLIYNQARTKDNRLGLRNDTWTRRPFSMKEASLLSSPQGIAVDEAYGEIYISDTGHDRILIFDLEGRLNGIIGDGSHGSQDGAFGSSSFSSPANLAYHADSRTLLVCEPSKGRIRKVNMEQQQVSTIRWKDKQGSSSTGLALPRHMDLQGERLDLVLDDGRSVLSTQWKSGVINSIRTYPIGQSGLNRKTKKAELAKVQDELLVGEDRYVLDQSGNNLIRWDEKKLVLEFSSDMEVAKGFKQTASNLLIDIDRMYHYAGDLYMLDRDEGELYLFDMNKVDPVPVLDSVQYIHVDFISDLYFSDTGIYFSDAAEGRFGIIEAGVMRTIKPKSYDDVVTLPQRRAHLMLDAIHPSDSDQTLIKFGFDIPEGFILDPEMKSTLNVGVSSKAVLNDYDVTSRKTFEIYLIPSELGTQLNLMADLYLMSEKDPSQTFFLPLQVTIPFDTYTDMSSTHQVKAPIEQIDSY